MVKRVQGGLRGFLTALERAMDPDSLDTVEERGFVTMTAAEIRAAALRDHRRAKKASRRPPF